IQQASKPSVDSACTMTVNGTNFFTESVVKCNGSPRATTVVSGTQLTASIPASDLTTLGTDSITAVTPAPGGGTSNSATFAVNKATVDPHIIADNKVYDGTTAATILTRTLTGVIGTDDVSLTGGTATFADKNFGPGKTVTATGLSLTGTKAGNYQLSSTSATTTANITARPITVTAVADTKTYDGTTSSAGTPTITTGSLATGDTTTSFTQVFDSRNASALNGRTLTPSGTVNDGNSGGNYAYPFSTANGPSNKRPITVTAASDTKQYDGTSSSTSAE